MVSFHDLPRTELASQFPPIFIFTSKIYENVLTNNSPRNRKKNRPQNCWNIHNKVKGRKSPKSYWTKGSSSLLSALCIYVQRVSSRSEKSVNFTTTSKLRRRLQWNPQVVTFFSHFFSFNTKVRRRRMIWWKNRNLYFSSSKQWFFKILINIATNSILWNSCLICVVVQGVQNIILCHKF